MWAINKSPLMLGGILDTKLSKTSLAIMSNKEVIAINQDSLGRQAQLVRRHTVEEWDIWLGELSGARKVLGVANWKNASQTAKFDLSTLGIASAQARDIWAAKDIGSVSATQSLTLAPHELKLWILSNITTALTLPSTYYPAPAAKLSGSASATQCPSNTCLPTGKKISNIGPNASVTFPSITATKTSNTTLVGVDFVNYDYAFTTAWDWGTNTRNMTIAVNGGAAKRWAFPLSGGDWYESGRLYVEVEGFKAGAANQLVFAGVVTGYGPDLVGIEVFG